MKSAAADSASVRHRRPNRVYQFLDRHLVGKSDSADYTDKWRQKFAKHPTWCDADMALQQINAGKAEGNRIALYARALFQRILYNMGDFVQSHPIKILVVILACMAFCFGGLRYVTIEVDIVKLWVSQGGRLDEELNFRSFATEQYIESKRHKRDAPAVPNPIKPVEAVVASSGPEIPRENGLGGGFQVVIQTPEHPGENVVAREGLLRHVRIMEEIAQYKVDMYGANWTLADICFKPPAPTLPPGTLNAAVGTLLERIIPCIWITPIDCFWEGAKPLGPHPALELGEEVSAFISSIPKGKVTWKNLNPSAVINEVSTLLDLGTIKNFFDRAGIGAAYLDRPCIDPLDHECPKDAPNHFDRCAALEKFNEWNAALDDELKIALAEEIIPVQNPIPELNLIGDLLGRKKRQASNESEEAPEIEAKTTTEKAIKASKLASTPAPATNKTAKKDDDDEYYSYSEDDDYKNAGSHKTVIEDPKAIRCQKFGKDFLRWMQENPKKWDAFLPKSAQPQYPDYGKIMTGGCKGFGRNIMKWPEDLIIGGIKRDNTTITSAEAFQSVFLVAGAEDVFQRHRGPKTKELKPNFDPASWNPSKANTIITAWQRNFTNHIYAHELNRPQENLRVVHPLASTSIADMLEEFSQFQFFVIFIGYVLMILYAGSTQFDWKGWWFSVKSATGIAITGVLIITFSSIAGLGFSSSIGINFNAATTQIVPFLTLGLGIDDMFLLMHNYQDLLNCVREREIAVLMKETGMSILITSTNNILAFLAGIVLPIPALRSFCSQTAILLMFNLFTTMILFPAVMALDIKRRKSNRRDMTLPGCGSKDEIVPTDSTVNVITAASTHKDPKDYPWFTLEHFLHNYYLPLLHKKAFKIAVVIVCIGMFTSGCIGLYRSKLGLELADVLPEGTAPSAFLKAREKYFSFYPMFAVLKGPGIDYPNQQMKIEELRNSIAKSDFVIKLDGKPSEPYWMSLMRIWLESLQGELDKGLASGVIDPVNGSLYIRSTTDERVNDEMLLARRLVCSYGTKFNCTGRISMVKLVDKDGIINPEGFYNYLTGWFHVDNMMYYVSQAAFFPTPPGWRFDPWEEAIVPAAEPLYYSQIPFYLTNLIDTPYIVDMIKEIRATSEEFTAEGLPNFPTGLAFTFWEQYLHLTKNLTTAIFIIGGSVLLVISLLIFNPWAASMVAVVVVSMTIELAGFMGIFGVKMNPISAVTLITAVGIGVEFTAHVVLAYLSSLGTRDERMEAAMEHMFIPVLHGCLSTLLGIIMLAFSEFDFVVKYFFVVMTALILIGLFNGVAMLPVMLSIIGPPCEIQTADGSSLLPPPPPLNKKKKKLATSPLALAEDGDIKTAKRDFVKSETDSSGPSSPSMQDSGDDEAVTISQVSTKSPVV